MKSQLFKSMDGLEYVLEQQEEEWEDEKSERFVYQGTKLQGGQPPSGATQNQVSRTGSGDESESDERRVIFEDEALESPTTQEAA
ncbi:hypothetical protein PHMEG_0003151 [Phytophthora megakarya]|uniref:Uncharacterized protein n=1 Tax=Phytophthora megakarya TaxID=4795 RepID=A0A225WWR0_9STRA|nr:hypothetical protein PHMEG_0003151 [Phytophthora megakarya]